MFSALTQMSNVFSSAIHSFVVNLFVVTVVVSVFRRLITIFI